MSAVDAMDSVRSPLSGDDDTMDISQANTHRRHQSAGTLNITEPDSNDTTTNQELQSHQTVISVNSPRIIDGVFEKKFKPENLTGAEKEKRIVEIIEQQFNLEILLKHNQLVEIEEEIGKCEAQMIALRNRYNVEPSVKLSMEPKEFTEKYLRILQKTEGLYTRHKSVTWNNNFLEASSEPQSGAPPTSETLYSRTRSHTSSLRPSSGRYSPADCIYRRTDGVYVKLTCPNCNRCNFSSAQGFLNHCRLAHQKEFTSQDNAAVICGEVLHDEDQDPDGVKVIEDLKKQGLDPNKNLAKPEVAFISQMLANAGGHPAPPPLEPGIRLNHNDTSDIGDQKKRGNSLVNGHVGSKTPRTTTKLKLKLRNLGKGSEFDDLVKDVTTEVENPHLFEDEEDGDTPDVSGVFNSQSSPRPSVSARGSSGNRGRGRGRGRRKSRGGFTLLQEDESDTNSKSKVDSGLDTSNKESNGANSAVDDDTTMG